MATGKNTIMSTWHHYHQFPFLPLTTYLISQNHMYAQDPQIFLHEGFPIQPSELLEIGHHSQSCQSPWTPSECPFEPSDTCFLHARMGGSPLWDHWHSGRPLENDLNHRLGRWAPWPSLQGLTWSPRFKFIIIQKKKCFWAYFLAAQHMNFHQV